MNLGQYGLGETQEVFVAESVQAIVMGSFDVDRSHTTADEVRRRFLIVERIFSQLRSDLGWGLQRIIDHLPRYLRCELDGAPWEPDNRKLWVPQDGN